MWHWLFEFIGFKTLVLSSGGAFFVLIATFAPGKIGRKNRIRLQQLLINPMWLAKYRELLRVLQELLNRVYGEARSTNALNLSFTLAVFYPILLFVWAYAHGGAHRLLGIRVLPAQPNLWMRWAWFTAAATYLAIMGILILRRRSIDAWFKHEVATSAHPNWLRLSFALGITLPHFPTLFACKWVLVAISLVVVAFAIINVFAGTFTGALASALAAAGAAGVAGMAADASYNALAFAIAGAAIAGFVITVASALAIAGTVTVAGAIALSAAAASGAAEIGTESLAWLLVLVVLPGINGIHDWVSLRVSRHFISQACKPRHWRHAAFDVALDGAFGLLFMLSITLVLPSAIEAVNSLSPLVRPPATVLKADRLLNWKSVAEHARDSPWDRGSMVTMMLVTTLIPTVLHILCGTLALALQWIPGQRLAEFLAQMNDEKRSEYGNVLDPALLALWLMGYVVLALLPILLVAQLAQWLWALPIAEGLYWVATHGAHPAWLLLLPLLYAFGRFRLGPDPITDPSRLLPATTQSAHFCLDENLIDTENPR